MGIALDKKSNKHRRVDILLVPHDEWATSLLYMTGSKEFNVNMQTMAAQLGLKLSEKGLFKISMDEKIPDEKIPTKTEKDVFVALGLPYTEPKDRN